MKNLHSFSLFHGVYYLLFSFLLGIGLNAQVSNYTFSQDYGTYTEITGGSTHSWNSQTSSAINIGFDFVFNGRSYSQFYINKNGYITFGGNTNLSGSPISNNNNGNEGVVSALGRALISGTSTSEIRYRQIGSSPNRIFVIQWKNARISGTTSNFNFQIRLHETTNIVEIMYGSTTDVTYSINNSVQVGLRGASNTDFNNRATSSNWNNTVQGGANGSTCSTTIAIVPPSGLIFRWTPPNQSFANPGTYNYTPHPSVMELTVEAVGAGGGGGSARAVGASCVFNNDDRRAASGGGGGAYAKSRLNISFSNTYTVVVGAGGIQSSGIPGGDSSFGSNMVRAAGGGSVNGTANSSIPAPGVGGAIANSIGLVRYQGGNGGEGRTGNREGSGGGGAAGSTGNGQNGFQSGNNQLCDPGNGGGAAGSGFLLNGLATGKGGGGGDGEYLSNEPGRIGCGYGAGGGGAGACQITSTANGGNGKSGIVVITDSPIFRLSNSVICPGETLVIYGARFKNVSSVRLNGNPISGVTTNTDENEISLTIPANATSGWIEVTTEYGKSRVYLMVNSLPEATVSHEDANSCVDNGNIIITPENLDFAGGRVWYKNDFATAGIPVGAHTYSGTATRHNSGGFSARLTTAEDNKVGTLTIHNPELFNTGHVLAKFRMFIGNGTGADEIIVNYGDLVVHFDTYRNGTEQCLPQNTDGGLTAVSIRYAGNQVQCLGTFNIRNAWRNVTFWVDNNNRISILLDGEKIADNIALPAAYSTADKSSWEWSFYGRTGGKTDEHRVDDLEIIAYNQYEYSVDGITWQDSNEFLNLGEGTYNVQIRTKSPNALCNLSDNVILETITLTDSPKTFTGLTDNSWSLASNWTQNIVPQSGHCVRIPTGKSVILETDDGIAKSLHIENGGKLEILSNGVLTLMEDFVNEEGGEVILRNDANLIQVDNEAVSSGIIGVERFVQNMNNILPSPMDYVYWGAPVTGQLFRGAEGFSPGTPSNRFFQYNEPNDYFVNTPDTHFQPGKGYAIRAESGTNPETSLPYENGYNKTYKFIGVPNNGIQNEYLLKKSPEGQGYNLVGNPYPSNINADVLFDMNSSIHGVLYLWTNNTPTPQQSGSGYTGNSYAIYNKTGGTPATAAAGPGESEFNVTEIPNGIIKVGQGFIVQAKEGMDNVPFVFANKNSETDEMMRVANEGAFYQRMAKDRFWLTLTSYQNIENTMLMGYIPGATDTFDQDFDSPALGESSDAIYSILKDEKLIIQGRQHPINLNDTIPVGVRIFDKGIFNIAIKEKEGVFIQQPIYLRDKVLNLTHDLNNGPYEFESEQGEFTDRFEIIYRTKTLANVNADYNELRIYKFNNEIVIDSSVDLLQDVEVYNINGQLIFKKSSINSKELRLLTQDFRNQIVFIRVATVEGQLISKKVIVQ